MKNQKDYIEEISEIRSIMERSSKFTSVSGLSGILAGVYALVGAYVAHTLLGFRPDGLTYGADRLFKSEIAFFILAGSVLLFAVGTAVFMSFRRAKMLGEPMWTVTTRNMLYNMALPLFSGGILVLIFLSYGLVGLLLPSTLVFYGLALFGAANYSYREIRSLGFIVTIIGLSSFWFVEYSVLFWAVGFGIMHIIYGTLIFLRYER